MERKLESLLIYLRKKERNLPRYRGKLLFLWINLSGLIVESLGFYVNLEVFDSTRYLALHSGKILYASQCAGTAQINHDCMRVWSTFCRAPVG